jgi:VIT1/CCC1 family predicted Fe2+/Mn2+ transporter
MKSLTALLWGFPAELVKEIRKTVSFLNFLSFIIGALIGIAAYIGIAGGAP